MAQKALLTAFVAVLLVGGLSATGISPADLINSALMTITPVLAGTHL
jgi:hypothetical protein